MTLIKALLQDQVLTLVETPVIASGGVKEDVVSFDFGIAAWDGYIKKAVFYRDKSKVYFTDIGPDNTAVIPWEVLQQEGFMFLGVFGTKGNEIKTSTVVRYRVERGAITTASDLKPTPGIIVDPDLDNTTQYPQMNDIVASFLENVTYDPSDYNTTQMTSYWKVATGYSKEEPFGLKIKVPNNTVLIIAQGGKTRQETASGEHTIYNVQPLANATFAIGGKIYKIVPEGGVRMIYAPSVYNVRDLGGWACDGGKVKYGKLFRGSEFTGDNSNDITDADKATLRDWCGIKVDLDLRNNSESGSATSSPLGDTVEYYRKSIYAYAQGFDTTDRTAAVAAAVKIAIDSVNAGKPVYIHCVSGADRTATIAFILLSLLGVSPSDKDKEYELTAFTEEADGARFRNTNYSVTNGNSWYALMQYFRNNFTGANDTEKVTAWAVSNGITLDSINQFRNNMISSSVGDITVIKEWAVTNTLSNCATNNSTAKVTDGDSYTATITANSGYTLSGAAVSVVMGGVDITSTAYSNGVISIPTVTGAVVITITAAVYVPTYTNVLPTAVDPDTKSGVWDGKGYRNGAYASSASPYYGTDAACWCTGAIAVQPSDVIYVKGATLEGSGHERLGAFAASTGVCYWCKQYTALSGMATVTKLGDKYYKIVLDPNYANYANIGHIMFSAQGTGDGVIVTKNEPIE